MTWKLFLADTCMFCVLWWHKDTVCVLMSACKLTEGSLVYCVKIIIKGSVIYIHFLCVISSPTIDSFK